MAVEDAPAILLLGGSSDQLCAVRTARRLGLRAVVVDQNPAAPGLALADVSAAVSTRDVSALRAFVDDQRARGVRFCGVSVMGSDIPQIVAELARHLGVPGPPPEAARLATHKLDMKRRLRDAGVAVPAFREVEDADAVRRAAADFGFPLVIKPVDRSGARGVFRVREGDDIDDLFAQSRAESFSGQVMAEAFLDGLQISTESLLVDGRGYTPGFADRNYEMLDRFAPHIIENGGWMPSRVSPAEREAVERLVVDAAHALGLREGVVKGDIVLTDGGPYVIEVALRLSGGDFSESLIPLGTGVDIVGGALRLAAGLPLDTEALGPRWERGVVNRYFFPAPGTLDRIEGVEDVQAKPWLEKLEFFYDLGDRVPPVRSHGERAGVFVVTGATRAEAEERAAWVYERVRLVTR